MSNLYPPLTVRDRIMLEVLAFALSFRFHDSNSFVRKTTTVVFFLTWSISTILLLTGHAVEMWMYTPMTAIVFYIVGREHEAEFHRLFRK